MKIAKPVTLPFNCRECAQHTPDEFSVFAPLNHWLLVIPEKRLIHLHYVEIAMEDRLSFEVAEFIQKHLRQKLDAYPEKTFFAVLDFSTLDNSVDLPPGIKGTYQTMLGYPEIEEVAIYQASKAMQSIIQLFAEESATPIHITNNSAEAQACYERWCANHF